jgi:hypothetical protein
MSQVESGRLNPTAHRMVPWPWTVQAEGRSYYFDTKAEAVDWVQGALRRGVTSIDTGCLQVNLQYHPTAFRNLDQAFDPDQNADYAGRLLVALHASTGDWQEAVGLYHSDTASLKTIYSQRVEDALNGNDWQGLERMSSSTRPPSVLTLLKAAWGATLDTTSVSPAPRSIGDWVSLKASPQRRIVRDSAPETSALLSYAE